MILSLLFLAIVALEIFLIFGQGWLPDARRRATLEASLRQAQSDLEESKMRIDTARAGLMAAVEEADRRRSELRDADEAFTESQKMRPALVHTVGEARAGRCFRAPLTKDLPPAPETSQQAIWGCPNFIDVWTDDAETARRLALRQFHPKHGYAIGGFVEIEPQAPAPAQRVAA